MYESCLSLAIMHAGTEMGRADERKTFAPDLLWQGKIRGLTKDHTENTNLPVEAKQ